MTDSSRFSMMLKPDTSLFPQFLLHSYLFGSVCWQEGQLSDIISNVLPEEDEEYEADDEEDDLEGTPFG